MGWKFDKTGIFFKKYEKKKTNFEEIFFYEELIKQVNLNYDYQKIWKSPFCLHQNFRVSYAFILESIAFICEKFVFICKIYTLVCSRYFAKVVRLFATFGILENVWCYYEKVTRLHANVSRNVTKALFFYLLTKINFINGLS